jgi:hypothetical protein
MRGWAGSSAPCHLPEVWAAPVVLQLLGVELLRRSGSRSSALDPRRQGKSAKLSQLAKNGTSPSAGARSRPDRQGDRGSGERLIGAQRLPHLQSTWPIVAVRLRAFCDNMAWNLKRRSEPVLPVRNQSEHGDQTWRRAGWVVRQPSTLLAHFLAGWRAPVKPSQEAAAFAGTGLTRARRPALAATKSSMAECG